MKYLNITNNKNVWGACNFNDVFLNIYPHDPTSKFHELKWSQIKHAQGNKKSLEEILCLSLI